MRMTNPGALHVKAKAVARQLGHSDGEPYREYKDWHIEVRSGTGYVSVWSSAQMVFLSMSNTPVYYQPGPWEQYLERLFQRTS
jgi:hypothetical protein